MSDFPLSSLLEQNTIVVFFYASIVAIKQECLQLL